MLDNYAYNESVEDSYRYFGYISEEEVEWYFLQQNEIEAEIHKIPFKLGYSIRKIQNSTNHLPQLHNFLCLFKTDL